MDHAVLLTGDRDFTPLVETLVQFGLIVHVVGDFRSTSDVLKEAADHYQPLALTDYLQLVDSQQRQDLPAVPQMIGRSAAQASAGRVAEGPIAQEQGQLFEPRSEWYVFEISNRHGVRHIEVTGKEALTRLTLFLELQYGEVPWLKDFIKMRYV